VSWFERQHRATAIAALVVVLFLCAQIITFGFGRDQGIYALVARSMLDGGMPYRDAFDFKPPGIFLIYAAARWLFGPVQWGVRVLEVAGLIVTVALVAKLAQRWWKQPAIGLLAGVLTALVHAQLDFWHTAQPETFGGMLTVAAVALAARADADFKHWLGAGLLFGCAGLLKPPLAGGGAVLACWAALGLQRKHGSWRTSAKPIGWVLLGGSIPFATCTAWFAARDAWSALYAVLFEFTPHYTALSWRGRHFVGLLYDATTLWFSNYCSLITIGLCLHLASWQHSWKKAGVGLLWSLIAMQLVGVALQAKMFAYHFAGIWPLAALLAASGWWRAWQWASRRSSKSLVAVALSFVIAGSLRTAAKDMPETWWLRVIRRVQLLSSGDVKQADALATLPGIIDASRNRTVARELAKRVPPGQSIYIFGFEPVIYDLADRPAASRYIYNVPQRVAWAAETAQAELMAELDQRRPAAILVAHGDRLPVVTGNDQTSHEALREFSALRRLLTSKYGKLKHLAGFDLYVLR